MKSVVTLESLRALIGKRVIATKMPRPNKPLGAQYLGTLDKVSPKRGKFHLGRCGGHFGGTPGGWSWLGKHTTGRWFTPENFASVIEDPEYTIESERNE